MVKEMIKFMRKSAGFFQKDLARLLDGKPTTISGYETGLSNPNYDKVEEIAKLCDFQILFLDKNSGELYFINKDGVVEKFKSI